VYDIHAVMLRVSDAMSVARLAYCLFFGRVEKTVWRGAGK